MFLVKQYYLNDTIEKYSNFTSRKPVNPHLENLIKKFELYYLIDVHYCILSINISSGVVGWRMVLTVGLYNTSQ